MGKHGRSCPLVRAMAVTKAAIPRPVAPATKQLARVMNMPSSNALGLNQDQMNAYVKNMMKLIP